MSVTSLPGNSTGRERKSKPAPQPPDQPLLHSFPPLGVVCTVKRKITFIYACSKGCPLTCLETGRRDEQQCHQAVAIHRPVMNES